MHVSSFEKIATGLVLGGIFWPSNPVSLTSYNWLVSTWPRYGRKSDEKTINNNKKFKLGMARYNVTNIEKA